jgi:SAM-dependent methyltransferase
LTGEEVSIVTIANTEMAAAWDGPEGEHWTRHAARYERASRANWQRFLDTVPIGPHDTILDVGCGTGRSTRDAARISASGSALGVDLSSRMLGYAREAAEREGLTNVDFRQADAQVFPFPDSAFDLVISNFGAMFFADPTVAFTNLRRSLRDDGRLALLAWRELARNEWLTAIRDALAGGRQLPVPPASVPGPFGLADGDHVRRVLGAAGFVDIGLDEVGEPTEFGSDAEDAFAFVSTLGIAQGLTQELDEDSRARVLDSLRRTLVEHDTGDGVLFGTSAWLVTARAGGRRTA